MTSSYRRQISTAMRFNLATANAPLSLRLLLPGCIKERRDLFE